MFVFVCVCVICFLMFFSFFSTSIIGHIYTLTTFTQGTWDASLRKITITRAFPGKSMVQHNHDHQNALQEAEMDPVCEVVLKSQVESCGLQVVGWYVLYLFFFCHH